MNALLPARFDGKEELFTVEIATPDCDLGKIVSVVNAAYARVKYLQRERIFVGELRSLISHPQRRLYLCISPTREICGTILLEFLDRETAEIGLVSIHPNYQRKNLGPRFINYVEQEAFKKVQKILLKVIRLYQKKLVKFYLDLGYEPTGQRMNFLQEEKQKYIRPEDQGKVFFSIMRKNRPESLC